MANSKAPIGVDFAALAAKAAGGTAPAAERPEAQVWVNVGVPVTTRNAETGEDETMFVSTPYGIPLDTMSPQKGNSKIARAKNTLLENLMTAAEGLAPGEDMIVDLQVQVRRIADPDNTEGNDELKSQIPSFVTTA